jgi:hypothetical protein
MTDFDVKTYIRANSNWGRWGDQDELGALNLVTDEKRLAAARLVQTGRAVSLSRDFPAQREHESHLNGHHFMKRHPVGRVGGTAVDYYGILYHGRDCTHMDALCHLWDESGMWNGHSPDEELTFEGSKWGGIQQWSRGLFTRGVLFDVPAMRGVEHVEFEQPVLGEELSRFANGRGLELESGDALVVYCGRDRFDALNPGKPWAQQTKRPGLDASCLKFIHESDCSALVWDMMDKVPHGLDVPFTVHAAIQAFGIALIDNADLGEVVRECRRLNRYEFLLTVAPLKVVGGTGSPANPTAVF